MSQIDLFIKSLARFDARGVTLASDRKVALLFDNGHRYANQTICHNDLVSLVLEVAPAEATAHLRRKQPACFDYILEQVHYAVDVKPSPKAWQVTVAPVPAVEQHAPQKKVSQRAPSPSPTSPGVPAARGRREAIRPAADPNADLLHRLLIRVEETEASDLHLVAGCRPFLRVHGEMVQLTDEPELSAQQLTEALDAITPDNCRKEFARRNDTDFAHAVPGQSRYRVNRFKDRRGPGAVIRTVPFDVIPAEELGLPESVLELCTLDKGLVLVTGPTGSGKSTTLAAMVDRINQTRGAHIITIEDPIEFIHENKRCLINQRQVGDHTDSFKDALRAALREDPDIVLVGEMRDLETVAIAVETAETGHLVFGTLHTTTAPGTVDRVIDQFPADRQAQIREMLADTLRGVVAQTLCKRVGGGRVAAFEVLLSSPAVANLIRERKVFQLPSLMQTGKAQGMRTLNDSLAALVREGLVEPAEALRRAVSRDELKRLLPKEGQRMAV